MKRRLILLVVVIALIAGFGALLHSPPSIIDAVTGATPKAKKAAQSSAQLEGSYIFCMNPLLDKLSDEDIREQLKAFVTGKTDSIRTDTELSFDIDFENLYYNMLDAKADYLFNLPQWDAIFSGEKRREIQFRYRDSKTVRNEEVKVGRNEPCPCGSGKKYKKCCGK